MMATYTPDELAEFNSILNIRCGNDALKRADGDARFVSFKLKHGMGKVNALYAAHLRGEDAALRAAPASQL